jgi:hypothetical protein
VAQNQTSRSFYKDGDTQGRDPHITISLNNRSATDECKHFHITLPVEAGGSVANCHIYFNYDRVAGTDLGLVCNLNLDHLSTNARQSFEAYMGNSSNAERIFEIAASLWNGYIGKEAPIDRVYFRYAGSETKRFFVQHRF